MNERIRQLAEQAGAETWSRAPMRAVTGLAFTDENLKKFAELIVAECLAIAKNREDELENANLLKASNAVGFVAYQIARQFGVDK